MTQMNWASSRPRNLMQLSGADIPGLATAQATSMFESTDTTAARVVALLGRQIGVLAVEEWNDDDSRR